MIQIRYSNDINVLKSVFFILKNLNQIDALNELRKNIVVKENEISFLNEYHILFQKSIPFENGKWVNSNDRVLYTDNKVYRVVQGHEMNAVNNPTVLSLYRPVPVIAPNRKYPLWNSIGLMDSENNWKFGEKVDWNNKYFISTIDNNVFEPETQNSGWQLLAEESGITELDINKCDNTPDWNGNNHLQYLVGHEVKYDNKIWIAKNTTHTWIAPSLTGDGSISWEHVQDCIL